MPLSSFSILISCVLEFVRAHSLLAFLLSVISQNYITVIVQRRCSGTYRKGEHIRMDYGQRKRG